MKEQKKIIEQLKAYFEKRDEVLMAFLFGSQASGRARKGSDWDIAVYLAKESEKIENAIWLEVERIVKTEVDLIVLNRAPASLASRILREGKELASKDRKLYIYLLLRVSEEADAFYKTVQEYYEVFERSASLNEDDREVLTRITVFLEEEIKDYERFKNLTFLQYEEDRMKRLAVEHWIERLVNAAVDAGKIILASERRNIPDSYKNILIHLGTVKPFSKDSLCEKMADWVSLRNVLAHEYLDIRWHRISKFIHETEPLWQEFAARIKSFLEKY